MEKEDCHLKITLHSFQSLEDKCFTFESIDIQILFFIQEHYYKTSLFDKLMPIITKLEYRYILDNTACIFIL